MIRTLGMAAAAQSPARFGAKILLSAAFVAAASLVNRGGFALAVLVVFSGVTGPAIRIMTLKINGMYDRLAASPVFRPALVLGYTGIWSAAVLAALAPAIAVSAILSGPALILPAGAGIVLAVVIGTSCGLAAKTLGDAHFFAVLAAIPLLAGAVVPGPWSLFLPFSSLVSPPATLSGVLFPAGFTVACLAMLGGLATRM